MSSLSRSLFPDCFHLLFLTCAVSLLPGVSKLCCHSAVLSYLMSDRISRVAFCFPVHVSALLLFPPFLPCCAFRLFGFSFPVQLLIVSSVDLCLSFLNYHIPPAPILCCTHWSNKSRLKSLLPRQSAFGFLFCLPCGTLTLTNTFFGGIFHVSFGWRPD